ncbi:MAG: tRNA 2-thiouridine(34) synthase MnmA [Oscillospiraceae bacterium]
MSSIVVGLSGGVDSAVAAYKLIQDGHRVTGVFLKSEGSDPSDAENVARFLGCDFIVKDISATLEREVIEPFIRAYREGRTPNPCVTCNPNVKFPFLFAAADSIGAQYAATGHYARTDHLNGRYRLLRGRPENDQSYMLAGLRQDQLARIVFPLGTMVKAQVRALAREIGLPVADKPDSMEICFVTNGDFAEFIESRGEALPPGDIVDTEGNVLGRHKGLHRYTLGQRRGLGVAGGRRLFVRKLDMETNRLVLSEGDELYADRLFLSGINWISVAGLSAPARVSVRVRHSRTEAAATALPQDDGLELVFEMPVRAPTPGQTAAIYSGDAMLASAVIE